MKTYGPTYDTMHLWRYPKAGSRVSSGDWVRSLWPVGDWVRAASSIGSIIDEFGSCRGGELEVVRKIRKGRKA